MYNTQNYISKSVNDNYNNVNLYARPTVKTVGRGEGGIGRGGNYGTRPVGIGEQLERGGGRGCRVIAALERPL